jgi:hypothetical protein
MRAAGLLIVLCAGAWSQAGAADRPPLSPPQSSPAPAEQPSATAPASERSTATPATPAVSAAPAASATSTVTPTPAATAAPDGATDAAKAEMTRKEHELLARGYKLEIRHGERYFCRREAELGSHFDVKTCNTAESIESHRANSVETVREMQANKPEISN